MAYVDLYSRFPSAVQIGGGELGLALDDPLRPCTVVTIAGPGELGLGDA